MLAERGRLIITLVLTVLILLMSAAVVGASETGQVSTVPPAVGQTLIREGDFAVKLAEALSLGSSLGEVEAEDRLTEAGIMPKNGWIANYPVTPDIAQETREAVQAAASSGKIELSADAAMKSFDQVLAQAGLGIGTQASTTVSAKTELKPETTEYGAPPVPPDYQSPTVINNYYQTEGPPTVTYYAPPPTYAYLYGWVPYSFWCSGFWFPGFFILHDFHRPVFIDNRVVFVSNHFRDTRFNRFTRIDPVARIRGDGISGRTTTTRTPIRPSGAFEGRVPRTEVRTSAPARTSTPSQNRGVVTTGRGPRLETVSRGAVRSEPRPGARSLSTQRGDGVAVTRTAPPAAASWGGGAVGLTRYDGSGSGSFRTLGSVGRSSFNSPSRTSFGSGRSSFDSVSRGGFSSFGRGSFGSPGSMGRSSSGTMGRGGGGRR